MSVLTPLPASSVRRAARVPGWLVAACAVGPLLVVLAAAMLAGWGPAEAVRAPIAWGLWSTLTGILVAGWWLYRRVLARHLSTLLVLWLAGVAVWSAAAAWQGGGPLLALCGAAGVLGLPLLCGVVPWQRRVHRRRYALLGGGIADEVGTLASATWVPFEPERQAKNLDGVVADLHAQHATHVLNAIATQALRGVPVVHAAEVHELLTERVALRFIAEESLRDFQRPLVYDAVKRGLDLVLVLAGLPLVLPVMAIVALVVRLESPGPILFRQVRVGLRGAPFTMFKFRSMDHRATSDAPQFTLADDARVTRVGRFIRTFRIDELPQVWNVLRGEMSFIGPRPEQVPFVETFEEVIPLYPYRHTVRPGITGWSQVKLGYAASTKEAVEKLEYDLYYVKHLSFALDLLILFKTLRTIVTGYGAR